MGPCHGLGEGSTPFGTAMNIFFLDLIPRTSAAYHCDKHVVKMCLEYAQLLSTAIHVNSPELAKSLPLYKKTHENHPCAIWARYSEWTFLHLLELAEELGKEYTKRYGKVHKSIETVIWNLEIPKFDNTGWIDPPQCMPDQYKCENTVQAYRNYYNGDKARFAVWKYTKQPEWFNATNNN